jgi:hypothetical protein
MDSGIRAHGTSIHMSSSVSRGQLELIFPHTIASRRPVS